MPPDPPCRLGASRIFSLYSYLTFWKMWQVCVHVFCLNASSHLYFHLFVTWLQKCFKIITHQDPWKNIFSPGKVLEKSWNFVTESLWEPCMMPDIWTVCVVGGHLALECLCSYKCIVSNPVWGQSVCGYVDSGCPRWSEYMDVLCACRSLSPIATLAAPLKRKCKYSLACHHHHHHHV